MTDPARGRFYILAALRFGGALIAGLGAVIVARRLVEPAEIVGGLLMLVGAADATVVPLILARRWKTPPS